MTINGHVENGRIILDEPIPLAEGMKVRVELMSSETDQSCAAEQGPTLNDQLRPIIGIVDDLPSDFARNHDHYIYGLPKK
jgi:hypothetical protein